MKQPAAKLAAGENTIDRSGAGTSCVIGYKREDSPTHRAVNLGAAKFVVGTEIESNVIAGTLIFGTGNDCRGGAGSVRDQCYMPDDNTC